MWKGKYQYNTGIYSRPISAIWHYLMIGFYLQTGLKTQRLCYFPLFAKYKKKLERDAARCWFDVNSAVNIYNKVVFYHEEMIVDDICSRQSLHLSVTQHQCKSSHFQVLKNCSHPPSLLEHFSCNWNNTHCGKFLLRVKEVNIATCHRLLRLGMGAIIYCMVTFNLWAFQQIQGLLSGQLVQLFKLCRLSIFFGTRWFSGWFLSMESLKMTTISFLTCKLNNVLFACWKSLAL